MRRTPQRVEKISNYLAEIAPDYFAGMLENPVIIIGNNRSGKSLFAGALAIHQAIAAFPGEALELWHPQAFPWLSSKHRDYLPPFGFDPARYSMLSLKYRTSADDKKIRAVFGAYRLIMGKKVFLNESSMITFMIPYIIKLFPGVKFIHIVRDGRDVALAWAKAVRKQVDKRLDILIELGYDMTFGAILRTLAECWKLTIEEIEDQKETLDLYEKGILYECRYEDFCLNPHDYLYKTADFMEISPSEYKYVDYSYIACKSYEYRKELNDDDIIELTQIMEHPLARWGYL